MSWREAAGTSTGLHSALVSAVTQSLATLGSSGRLPAQHSMATWAPEQPWPHMCAPSPSSVSG